MGGTVFHQSGNSFMVGAKHMSHIESNNILPLESGKAPLAKARYQKPLYELQHLVSVTQKNYQALYINLLEQVAEWMQALPCPLESAYQNPYGLFTLSFARAIIVLKHRRAYMLPPGANAETCYQQQDMWTYGLFTAALLKDCWQVAAHFEISYVDKNGEVVGIWQPLAKPPRCAGYYYKQLTTSTIITAQHNLVIAKQFIPATGGQWLQRFQNLHEDWLAYLNHTHKANNVIAAVIQKAEAALLNKSSAAVQHSFSPVLNSAMQRSETFINSSAAEETAQTAIQKTSLSKTAITSHTAKANNDAVAQAEITLADQFLDWLKQALSEERFTVNHLDDWEHSFIQVVAEGVLLVMPDLWDQFLAAHPAMRDDSQQLVNNNSYFIKKSDDQFIHRYCLANWQSRQVKQTIKGLLLKSLCRGQFLD
jgi:hypothetical protein